MTNRKTFIGMLAVCLACVFTSCSDSDDAPTPQTPAATYAGKLVAQAGKYRYMHDDNNRCYKIYNGNFGSYAIDYDKGTIYIEEDDEMLSVTFNGKGYITELNGTWSYEDEGVSESGKGRITFEYNSNGQLIKETSVSSGVEIENGKRHDISASYQAAHTWKDNNHISSVCKSVESEDGKTDVYENTYTVRYSDIKNVTGQNTFAMTYALNQELYEPLVLTGMFGNGSAYMPSEVEWTLKESYDGNERTYNGTEYASYSLNDNGTVNTEMFDGRKEYSYISVNNDGGNNKVSKKVAAAKGAKKGSWVRDFFMRYRASK